MKAVNIMTTDELDKIIKLEYSKLDSMNKESIQIKCKIQEYEQLKACNVIHDTEYINNIISTIETNFPKIKAKIYLPKLYECPIYELNYTVPSKIKNEELNDLIDTFTNNWSYNYNIGIFQKSKRITFRYKHRFDSDSFKDKKVYLGEIKRSFINTILNFEKFLKEEIVRIKSKTKIVTSIEDILSNIDMSK